MNKILIIITGLVTFIILSALNTAGIASIEPPVNKVLSFTDVPIQFKHNNTVIESSNESASVIESFTNEKFYIKNAVFYFKNESMTWNKLRVLADYFEVIEYNLKGIGEAGFGFTDRVIYIFAFKEGNHISVIETNLVMTQEIMTNLLSRSLSRIRGDSYA